jgi:hypothetical protein
MQTMTMADGPSHSHSLSWPRHCAGRLRLRGMKAVTRSPPVRPRAAILMINMHQMHRDQCSASGPSPLGATFARRRSVRGVLTNLLTIQDAPPDLRTYTGGRCARLHRPDATSRTSMAWKRSAAESGS